MKLPGLDDRSQLEAVFVYVMMLLSVFLGLSLVVVTVAKLDGAAVIGTLATGCITAAGGVLALRVGRRGGSSDE